jgi:signal transduction histidine kinase
MQLFALSDEVSLEIADDGAGFEPGSLDVTPGFGVRGLLERARGLDGWAEISSAPGRGTTVMFSIPPVAVQRVRTEAPPRRSEAGHGS